MRYARSVAISNGRKEIKTVAALLHAGRALIAARSSSAVEKSSSTSRSK
jgi:hypothetical protein